MMDKPQIYNKLASIVLNSKNDLQVQYSKILASKLMVNNISVEEANTELSKIIILQKNPVVDSIKGKRVHKNLIKYYNGELDSREEVIKLVSSLITHSAIESSTNPSMDLSTLVLLSEYLTKSLSSIDYFDTDELNHALDIAGIGKEVTLIEQ